MSASNLCYENGAEVWTRGPEGPETSQVRLDVLFAELVGQCPGPVGHSSTQHRDPLHAGHPLQVGDAASGSGSDLTSGRPDSGLGFRAGLEPARRVRPRMQALSVGHHRFGVVLQIYWKKC